MKKIYLLMTLVSLAALGACNKEWEGEQFAHYISFKAPLDGNGVTPIHVRYKPDGAVTYQLPLLVSGSTNNTQNLVVHVGLDPDTLQVLNYQNFQSREDLYYKELPAQYFSIPDTVHIESGKNKGIMDIDFTLKDIDLVNKWILPLTVVSDPSYGYTANPRRNYSKALLRIIPFNDYSGVYSATALRIYLEGNENGPAIVKNDITTYVVDDHSIFFYAGTIDEDRTDRGKYKIYANFDERTREVAFTAADPNINFRVNETPHFSVEEVQDELRPYLVHRYVTISNINYNYTDYTSVANATISYTVKGSLIMERKINTQIPDVDQAIQW